MWRLKIAEGGGPWLRTTNGHVGRQVWEFDQEAGTDEEIAQVESAREAFQQNRFDIKHSADIPMRQQFAKENPIGIQLPSIKLEEHEDVTEEAVSTTLRRAINCYSTLQAHDGHWPGDYGGPMFLMPGLIISLSVAGALHTVLSLEHQKEMCRYLYNHQNKDGGWGLHIEGHSTMFGSVLTYITLRLLGESAEDGNGAIEKGRNWILDHGGATYITSWGKFWLSILGLFDWSGNNPLPPESWLLPYVLPVHPGRMWCHCRMVYLPMSYIYGKRFVGPITTTVLSLRKELYTIPFNEIDWNMARNQCAKEDLYYPHPLIQDLLWTTLHKVGEPIFMNWPCSILRKKALSTVMKHIHYEDENTRYICIGPVNKSPAASPSYQPPLLCCEYQAPLSPASRISSRASASRLRVPSAASLFGAISHRGLSLLCCEYKLPLLCVRVLQCIWTLLLLLSGAVVLDGKLVCAGSRDISLLLLQSGFLCLSSSLNSCCYCCCWAVFVKMADGVRKNGIGESSVGASGVKSEWYTPIPGGKVTSVLLNGRNFTAWSRSFRLLLGAWYDAVAIGKKMPRPADDDLKVEQWDIDNWTIFGWFFSSMEPSSFNIFMYHETADSLWKALTKMYAHFHNEARIFELHQEISRASQEGLGLSVSEFFGYLHVRLDELAQYDPVSDFGATTDVVVKRLDAFILICSLWA